MAHALLLDIRRVIQIISTVARRNTNEDGQEKKHSNYYLQNLQLLPQKSDNGTLSVDDVPIVPPEILENFILGANNIHLMLLLSNTIIFSLLEVVGNSKKFLFVKVLHKYNSKNNGWWQEESLSDHQRRRLRTKLRKNSQGRELSRGKEDIGNHST